MLAIKLTPANTLPEDGYAGVLAGRVFRPDVDGPSVVAIRADGVYDVSAHFPTMSELCEQADPAAALRAARLRTPTAISTPLRGKCSPLVRCDGNLAAAPSAPWLPKPASARRPCRPISVSATSSLCSGRTRPRRSAKSACSGFPRRKTH